MVIEGEVDNMKVKIFKSHIAENYDSNNIEANVNSFIRDKKVVSIQQSTCFNETSNTAFIAITVLYEE
ncbi:MAG: hypothetical protein K0R80_1596 [Clostridia bacterium]|jgi:hypothetical protein|nr:hypothetical protein [Clostridia bacterium]